jgi:hypothetical protein
MGIGSLAKLGISKGIGRELFGFLLRSDLNVAKIAEWAGITMDTLKDAPPEALSAILERAARSGAIDPREANNINIQLAKDAQEATVNMINGNLQRQERHPKQTPQDCQRRNVLR